MTAKRDKHDKKPTPEVELRSCIGRLDPKTQKLTRAVRAAVRKRFPTANELAYDYGHSLVIGYSPTDRGIDAIVALAARATGVSLYFSQGPKLPDPKGILQGSAKQVRYIQVEAAKQVADPYVESLIAAAIEQAKIPPPTKGNGTLVIKATAASKRARKKPA